MKSYRKIIRIIFILFILFIFYMIYKYPYYESLMKDNNVNLKFEKNIL